MLHLIERLCNYKKSFARWEKPVPIRENTIREDGSHQIAE